jgi:hypothetical protein
MIAEIDLTAVVNDDTSSPYSLRQIPVTVIQPSVTHAQESSRQQRGGFESIKPDYSAGKLAKNAKS